jgi:hypothetical protein
MEENNCMASRERDDAMAGLLKRSLAGDADAGNDCPAPEILAAYFEQSLDPEEEAGVELHFSKCARCREQFAALGRAEQAAVAPASSTPREAARASWIWDWRWLAPVAAVLVITAIWATRRTALMQIAERAMQAPAAVTPPAKTPTQQATPQAKEQDKPQVLSRTIAPEPSAASAARQAGPAPNFSDSKTAMGAPAASLQNSPSANSVAPESASSDELLKKAAAQQSATDQARSAPPVASTNESVTLESETAVATSAPTPSPARVSAAPARQEDKVGVVGGVASGVAGAASGALNEKAQAPSAKQAPALVSTFRDRTRIISANQAGELPAANIIPTPDPRISWRLASGGFIERSEDGGATWNGQMPNQNAHFVAGSAPSAKICWLAGDHGIILLTQDASYWQVIPPPVNSDFIAISARNASSATVTTADGRKFTTTNRGKSWSPAK